MGAIAMPLGVAAQGRAAGVFRRRVATGMAAPKRVAMFTRQVQREVSELFRSDPEVLRAVGGGGPDRFASVANVHVTNDLGHVKVYVSLFGAFADELDRADAVSELQALEGHVCTALARRMNVRTCPVVRIYEDEIKREADNVERLMERIAALDEQRRADHRAQDETN